MTVPYIERPRGIDLIPCPPGCNFGFDLVMRGRAKHAGFCPRHFDNRPHGIERSPAVMHPGDIGETGA